MTVGILGKKIGMTQLFQEDGKWIPVTVVQAGPCRVLQVKSKEVAELREEVLPRRRQILLALSVDSARPE